MTSKVTYDYSNIPPVCPEDEIHLYLIENPLVTEKVVLFRDPDEFADHYEFKDNIFYITKAGKRGKFDPRVSMHTFDADGKKRKFTSHINLLRYPTIEEYRQNRKLYDLDRDPSKYSISPTRTKTVDELYSKYSGLTQRQFEMLLIQVAQHELSIRMNTADEGLRPTLGTVNFKLQMRVVLNEVVSNWYWLYPAFLQKRNPVFRTYIDPHNDLKAKELVGIFFSVMTSPFFARYKGCNYVIKLKNGKYISDSDHSEARPKLYPLIQYVNAYRSNLAEYRELLKDIEDEEIEIEDV